MVGRAALWTGRRVLRQADSKCGCRHPVQVLSSGSGAQLQRGHSKLRSIVFSLITALAALALPPCAAPANAAGLHIEDQIFLLYATEMDRTQLRLGQLAADKAQDEQVRAFARRMIDYHEQSNARLMQIAQQYGIETPQGVSPVAQRMQDELQGLTGPGFEYEYITSQVIYDYLAHCSTGVKSVMASTRNCSERRTNRLSISGSTVARRSRSRGA